MTIIGSSPDTLTIVHGGDIDHARRRFPHLKRESLAMNQKRFRRLYREEGLQVRKRGGRKRAVGLRASLALPTRPNER